MMAVIVMIVMVVVMVVATRGQGGAALQLGAGLFGVRPDQVLRARAALAQHAPQAAGEDGVVGDQLDSR